MFNLSMSDGLLLALFSLPAWATVLSLLPHDHWSMRIFDFPRVQIAVLNLLCLVLSLLLLRGSSVLFVVMECINLACTLWQLWQISAYTRLRRPAVLAYAGADNDHTVSILTSNVLTPNRQAGKLLALIDRHQPDMVLTLESDAWWEQQLSVLEKDYAWFVKIPLDNLYGMHLYSRLPLRNAQVLYRVRDDIPSIEAEVQLRCGTWIHLYCLHPMPPSPTESDTSTERDGELLIVGKAIAERQHSCLVFGDLNDVAWSATSRLFQRISGLLDPRIGRGLYNTFHANWPLMRWPLDHIFHSSDFLVSSLKVLPHIGSDHFPVYGKFQYHPPAEQVHEEPQADADDREQMEEKIEAAEPIHERERVKYRQSKPD